jgi:hypothetical protein
MKPSPLFSARNVFVLALTAATLLTGCAKPDLKVDAKRYTERLRCRGRRDGPKDPDGALSFHAPDCVSVDAKGKTAIGVTAANRQDMSQAFAMPNTTWTQATIIKDIVLNNVQGTEATVTADRSAAMVINRPESRQTGTLYIDISVRDYCVKEKQGWRIKREKILP